MQGTLTASPGAVSAAPRSDRRALVFALLLGAIAAILVFAYLKSLGSRGEVAGTALPVVVASRDIQAGQRITDGMVEVKLLPEDAIASTAVKAKEQVVGQALRYPIARGEQLTNSRLVDAPTVAALSFQIPQGLRGFTVPVNVMKSPAALATPGDFVDVLAAFPAETLGLTPPAASQTSSARRDTDLSAAVTLIPNVQVLSVQGRYAEGIGIYESSTRAPPPKEVNVTYLTLAVTPEQAQLLTLAVDKASFLTISLRAFGDAEKPQMEPLPEWQLRSR